MRKILAYLLVLVFVFSAIPAFAEGGRGSVTIVGTPTDEIEEEFTDDAAFFEDGGNEEEEEWVVFDPVEEYLYDAELITEAMDTLDGMQNILLLGVDSRSDKIEGRTDTMILLTVDPKNKTIKMTSFLRDLYVEIPGRKNNRLNAAYVFGGFDLLARTFEKNFGIKPDAYVAVNLSGLATIIDELGGLYIDVDKNKIDRINAVIYHYNEQVLGLTNLKDGYLTKGGYQLLNGKQAEAWARYRHTEIDYQRSQRQRQLIE
ncbi:MAG: LCP family protein, partial [Clostridia bacterium]|nr:LCP family protein [Clostridia bacterium]